MYGIGILSSRSLGSGATTEVEFSNLKAKKWTAKRFHDTFARLLRTVDPQSKLKGKIRLEPMGQISDGSPKPPRLLIADGDEGQVIRRATNPKP